jgi:hypothetical protein
MDVCVAKTEFEYAMAFWSSANAITAFAVVQMIAYLLSAGASDSKLRASVIDVRGLALAIILISTCFYCTVVGLLGFWQIQLLEGNDVVRLSYPLSRLLWLRVAAIGAIGVLGFVITWKLRPILPSRPKWPRR